MSKTDDVLRLARRLLALEAETAAVRKELDGLVAEKSPRPPPAANAGRRRPVSRGGAVAAGDVQAVVLSLVLAEPEREFRAGDLRDALPGPTGKNSIESALQRLMRAGELERTGRGLYRAPRDQS